MPDSPIIELEVVEEVVEILEVAEKGDPGNDFPEAPNDGKLYGRQSEAWAEIPATGGGEWEDVSTIEVTGVAVDSLEWPDLDYSLYDYRLTGVIHSTYPTTGNWKWFSTEANAAAVVPGEYYANFGYLQNLHADLGVASNQFMYMPAPTTGTGDFLHHIEEALIYSDAMDKNVFRLLKCNTIRDTTTGAQTASAMITAMIGYKYTNSTPGTKLGLYNTNPSAFAVGTKLRLQRRQTVMK